MTKRNAKALSIDPLHEDELLANTLYRQKVHHGKGKRSEREKPTHYKICCISLYTEDIERLQGLVEELKRRGHTKASKSQVIRYALATVDLEKMPKGY